MGVKKCPWYEKCRNGNDGCYAMNPASCVRFMPLKGTNLTDIKGVIETPPNVDDDKFAQYFINWTESMGWSFCGRIHKYEEDKEEDA